MQIQTEHFGEVTLLNFTGASKEDLLFVLKMRNHPHVREWMYCQDEIKVSEHLNFIQKLKDDKKNQYFLVKKEKQIVGVIYFNKIDLINKKTFFGIYANLYEPISGAGRLLEEASLFYVANIQKLNKIYLEVFMANKKVINLHKKYGFEILEKQEKKGFEILSMAKSLEN